MGCPHERWMMDTAIAGGMGLGFEGVFGAGHHLGLAPVLVVAVGDDLSEHGVIVDDMRKYNAFYKAFHDFLES